jgi:hypothetical protein
VVARGGGVYPLYHVLADLAERRGAEVLPTESSDPLAVDGLALRDRDGTRLLVANMGHEARRVRVGPLPGAAMARVLDETNAEAAMRDPASFRSDAGTPLAVVEGWAELELLPYAVARIDAT